jgi:hypothetical protein
VKIISSREKTVLELLQRVEDYLENHDHQMMMGRQATSPEVQMALMAIREYRSSEGV